MFSEIRTACAAVAKEAEHVYINHNFIREYAASLPLDLIQTPVYDLEHHYYGDPDTTLAYLITLDAVNFGSGYFPHLKKRPGMSGYYTVASHLKDAFEARGALSPQELLILSLEDCATLFRQPLDSEVQRELMGLFAKALNDLGRFLFEAYEGSFVMLLEGTNGSAEQLAISLTRMPFFQDVVAYKGRPVPLYKRAQITVSDIALAFSGEGYGRFGDLDKLTIFADNLVPHVLRVDGVLSYSASLTQSIDRGELIPAGSPEEVELRAVALHAVELLVAELGGKVSAQQLDILLWNRGQAARYRELPRHRTRTVFY